MARILVTSTADADAAFIITNLAARAGVSIAARYAADFDKLYERLAEYPDSGAPRPGLGQGVRICVISPFIVIYEHIPDDEAVIIMRIVHGRRKISPKLLRGSSR